MKSEKVFLIHDNNRPHASAQTVYSEVVNNTGSLQPEGLKGRKLKWQYQTTIGC